MLSRRSVVRWLSMHMDEAEHCLEEAREVHAREQARRRKEEDAALTDSSDLEPAPGFERGSSSPVLRRPLSSDSSTPRSAVLSVPSIDPSISNPGGRRRANSEFGLQRTQTAPLFFAESDQKPTRFRMHLGRTTSKLGRGVRDQLLSVTPRSDNVADVGGTSAPSRFDNSERTTLEPPRAGHQRKPSSGGNSVASHETAIGSVKHGFVVDLIQTMYADFDLSRITAHVLHEVERAIRCERVTLFFIDRERQELRINTFHRRGSISSSSEKKGRDRLASIGEVIFPDDDSDDDLDDVEVEIEQVRIPLGKGSITGYVGETGRIVNVADVSQFPHYDPVKDNALGGEIRSLLTGPVWGLNGDILAVAQLVNKTGDDGKFTEKDERLFVRFMEICAVAIRNALLNEKAEQSQQKEQMLLRCAHEIFRSYDVTDMAARIMQAAAELVDCGSCSLFLLDDDAAELRPATMFDMAESLKEDDDLDNPMSLQRWSRRRGSETGAQSTQSGSPGLRLSSSLPLQGPGENTVEFLRKGSVISDPEFSKSARKPTRKPQPIENVKDIRIPVDMNSVTGACAKTGKHVLVDDAQNDPRVNRDIDNLTGETRNILAMPVEASSRLVGVALLANKRSGQFTQSDIDLFSAFCVYAGIGVNNALLYQAAAVAEKKASVALGRLRYHTTSRLADVHEVLDAKISPDDDRFMTDPSISGSLGSLDMDSEGIDEDKIDSMQMVLLMFRDPQLKLLEHLRCTEEVICRFFLTLRKNYRDVPYHNWAHAFSVGHAFYALLKNTPLPKILSPVEQASMLIAMFCHDVDHRGQNNDFQEGAHTELASLYGTQHTMEKHHLATTTQLLLSTPGHHVLENLAPEDFDLALDTIEHTIMSTDLMPALQERKKLEALLEEGGRDNVDIFHNPEHRKLLITLLTTACDVGSVGKPWEQHCRSSIRVATEFFAQGDTEIDHGFSSSRSDLNPMMDKTRMDDFPKWELGFLDFVCLPTFKVLDQMLEGTNPLLELAFLNRKHWQELHDAGHKNTAHLQQQLNSELEQRGDKEEFMEPEAPKPPSISLSLLQEANS